MILTNPSTTQIKFPQELDKTASTDLNYNKDTTYSTCCSWIEGYIVTTTEAPSIKHLISNKSLFYRHSIKTTTVSYIIQNQYNLYILL